MIPQTAQRARGRVSQRYAEVTGCGKPVCESIRRPAAAVSTESSACRCPHGPRRRCAVRRPKAPAGTMSLSRWSPTYTISSARTCAQSAMCWKKSGSGLATPRWPQVPIAATGRSRACSTCAARAVWLPTMPIRRGASALSWRSVVFYITRPDGADAPFATFTRSASDRAAPWVQRLPEPHGPIVYQSSLRIALTMLADVFLDFHPELEAR
jgi:hypothetical protein